MSLITHVVVLDPSMNEVMGLTEPLPFDERHQRLSRLSTEQAGGTKVFCQSIYAAAFNYLDEAAFREWFIALPWGYHEPLLLIESEQDDEPQVYRLSAGRLVDLAGQTAGHAAQITDR